MTLSSLPFVQWSNSNGPVPIGFWKNASRDMPAKFFGMIAFANSAMSATSGAHGYFVWITTVCGSCATTSLMAPSM